MMNCPSCGNKMLEMPVWNWQRKILVYYLCIDCTPYVRIIEFCIHRRAKHGGPWCTKMDKLCNQKSDPETGYVFCPQIREWQEKEVDWVKGQNRKFEKNHAKKT